MSDYKEIITDVQEIPERLYCRYCSDSATFKLKDLLACKFTDEEVEECK